jgi:hypothetical protein
VGAEYQPYEELVPITQENDALARFHHDLITLRREQPALQGADLDILHSGEKDEAYVYLRGEQGVARILVALNFGAEPQRLSLPISTAQRSESWRELWSGQRLAGRKGTLSLLLEPWAVQVWLPEAAQPLGGRR